MFPLAEIFFRPARVFTSLRTASQWVLPFAATMLLHLLAMIWVIQTAGIELVTLQRYEHNTRLKERMGEAKVNAAIDDSNSRVPKLLILGQSIGLIAATLLIVAGALTMAARSFQAMPRAGFGQMAALVSYAALPFALLRLLLTMAMLREPADASTLDLERIVSLSPAQLVEPGQLAPMVQSLAQSLDLVAFAQVAFLAFGFWKVTLMPFGRCLAICAVLWAMIILFNAALTAVV